MDTLNLDLNKPCEVYHAPSDVRLPKGKQAKNSKRDTHDKFDIYQEHGILKIDLTEVFLP
jgi:hypothetical protein